MNFYFTYGDDSRYPYQGGYTQIVADTMAFAGAAFRHYHPDRNPAMPLLNCAMMYTEEEFLAAVERGKKHGYGLGECREKIVIALHRETNA